MLYGDVFVNDRIVGVWTARRLTRVTDENAEYEYAVSVQLLSRNFEQQSVSGTITHRFSDGALVLIAKIMTWADEQVP